VEATNDIVFLQKRFVYLQEKRNFANRMTETLSVTSK